MIVIDNLDIAKPASRKLEALSEVRDGSIGEITLGYLTIEAAVLSKFESFFGGRKRLCKRNLRKPALPGIPV